LFYHDYNRLTGPGQVIVARFFCPAGARFSAIRAHAAKNLGNFFEEDINNTRRETPFSFKGLGPWQ
jgi:hypothetical protein